MIQQQVRLTTSQADAILGPVTAVRGTTAGGSTVFCVVAHNGNV